MAEEPTLRDICREYFGVQYSNLGEEDNKVDKSTKVDDDVQYTLQEELKELGLVSATSDRLDMLDDEFREKFRKCQRQLRLRRARN